MSLDGLFKTELVGGWAGRTQVPLPVARPRDVESLQRAVRTAWQISRSVIAKGAACSYADQILNTDGVVVDCTGISGIRSWDPTSGRIVAWAGTSLADILRVALRDGW